jgi:hypothetical protein
MNKLYTKAMAFLVGDAAANSDRVKAGVISTVGIIAVQIAGACSACAMILTPAVVQNISIALGGMAVTLIAALSKRDIAVPGQSVPGAATLPTSAAPKPLSPEQASQAAAFIKPGE